MSSTNRQWQAIRDRLAKSRERFIRENEVLAAKAIHREFPELTWGQAMQESHRIIARENIHICQD